MSNDSGHDEDLLDFDGDENDLDHGSIDLKDQDLLDDDERAALENVIAASANPNKSGMDLSGHASTSKNGGLSEDGSGDADAEIPTDLDGIKKRMKEMEDEAEKLKQMQTEMENQLNQSGGTPTTLTAEQKQDADARSVYVGNVDYGTTAEELESHFNGCGPIARVTILCDKYSSHPKGFAYIEFADKDSVDTAMVLDESLFRGRQIKVFPKRTNVPGVSSTNRAPWRHGRGRGRASFRGYRGFRGRPRRRSWYSPY